MPQHDRPLRLPVRLVLVGTACIIGGEVACLVGPLRYERIIHTTCHAVLYAGIACVFVGAALHLSRRLAGLR
jgi:hypothetical protein